MKSPNAVSRLDVVVMSDEFFQASLPEARTALEVKSSSGQLIKGGKIILSVPSWEQLEEKAFYQAYRMCGLEEKERARVVIITASGECEECTRKNVLCQHLLQPGVMMRVCTEHVVSNMDALKVKAGVA